EQADASFAVNLSNIAGDEPTIVRQSRRICFRATPVAGEDVVTSGLQAADRSPRRSRAIIDMLDADFDAREGPSDKTGAIVGASRNRGDDRRFGGAVTFD